MIEVTVVETGDNALAAVEDAIYTAIYIGTEARVAYGTQGFNPHIRFTNADTDETIRVATLRSLTR